MTTDTMDDLNNAIATMGGNWVKLNKIEHGTVDGEIVAFERRDKTFEGAIVMKKGTQTPRIEWVFTLKVADLDPDIADDDGLRKLSLNESGQRAIAAAVKIAGKPAEIGGRVKIKVTADGKTSTDQAEYKAVYEPPTAKVAIDTDDF